MSRIIPKKKNYYVFWPTLSEHKFEGNVKALILFIKKNRREIDTTLISESTSILKTAREHGLDVTRPITVKGLWSILRAEYILVDTSFSGEFSFGNFNLIQLWHGSGFKEVGARNEENKANLGYLKKIYDKFKIISATSEHDAKKQNESFGNDVSVVTGYPRNDYFFQNGHCLEDIKGRYGLKKYGKIISYAPTFRSKATFTDPPFSASFWEELNTYLKEQDAVFVIKKHPWDDLLDIPEQYERIMDLSDDIADVQELLLVTDLLITDYSSIATDFVLLNRPILIYGYDYVRYKKHSRSIYYDLEELLPKPFIQTEEELLAKVKDDEFLRKQPNSHSYRKFQRTFHKYIDGNSSKRVMEAVKKL